MTDLPFIQMLDQLETTMENIAQLMATYYSALLSRGIHDELAQKLTIEFQSEWVGSMFRNNKPEQKP